MPYIKKKTRNFAWKIFNKIEKNSHGDFTENGEKYFVENLFKKFQQTDTEKTIFDVGANIGQYSEMLTGVSKIHSVRIKIHLFEPTRKCFEELTAKFSQSDHITLNNAGISNINGAAEIYYDREESEGASLYQRNLRFYNVQMDKHEVIRLRRLDDYIKEKKIHHIDFLKMDIEGNELKALEGLGKYLDPDFIDFIQFEYGGTNLDSHTSLMELYQMLTDRGFLVAKVMPGGLEIRNYAPFMENFQNANYMAVSKNVE
ncbi:MAG: FkbM family methyltransferase [Syntrophales bacterium]